MTVVFNKRRSKLSNSSSEDIVNKLSLRAGSPLSHARERGRAKAIGREGPVWLGARATPRTLMLQREQPARRLKQAEISEIFTKKKAQMAINPWLTWKTKPRMSFTEGPKIYHAKCHLVCKGTHRIIITWAAS